MSRYSAAVLAAVAVGLLDIPERLVHDRLRIRREAGPYSRPCPRCGAEPGTPCTMGGDPKPRANPHAERRESSP